MLSCPCWLVQYAGEQKADVCVVGSRGLGGFRRWVRSVGLGAARVLQQGPERVQEVGVRLGPGWVQKVGVRLGPGQVQEVGWVSSVGAAARARAELKPCTPC